MRQPQFDFLSSLLFAILSDTNAMSAQQTKVSLHEKIMNSQEEYYVPTCVTFVPMDDCFLGSLTTPF
jgi:hypothetical protein